MSKRNKTTVLGRLGSEVGRGMLAGAVGTSAMTTSSLIEMKLRNRPPSTVPAEVAAKVLGVEPEQDSGRFNNFVHWQYGSSLGALRGILSAVGLKDPWASSVFFVLVWAGSMLMVPRLSDSTPPASQWGPKEILLDGWHHLVYAAATSVAFSTMLRARQKK